MILPPWVETLRPHQVSAIQAILTAYKQGNSLVMLDAPTGSGKTLIAEMVRQELRCRAMYLCSSINLQNQFAKDFPYAAILYGRSNYPTFTKSTAFPTITSADCNKERTSIPACNECVSTGGTETELHCRWCHPVTTCPYEKAKAIAIRSELVCTNAHYFLYEQNFVGNSALGRKLVIIDEADTIEDVLLSFVTVNISERMQKEYGIQGPERKTIESAWIEWAEYAEQVIGNYKRSSRCSGSTIDGIRNRIRTDRLLTNIKRLNNQETGIRAGGWVYTGYDSGYISFKPIEVKHLAPTFLWRHCSRWLLMSATMISFQHVVDSLGIDDSEVQNVKV